LLLFRAVPLRADGDCFVPRRQPLAEPRLFPSCWVLLRVVVVAAAGGCICRNGEGPCVHDRSRPHKAFAAPPPPAPPRCLAWSDGRWVRGYVAIQACPRPVGGCCREAETASGDDYGGIADHRAHSVAYHGGVAAVCVKHLPVCTTVLEDTCTYTCAHSYVNVFVLEYVLWSHGPMKTVPVNNVPTGTYTYIGLLATCELRMPVAQEEFGPLVAVQIQQDSARPRGLASRHSASQPAPPRKRG
jgi:hypothetical protein